jgi:hypothetical protein
VTIVATWPELQQRASIQRVPPQRVGPQDLEA